MTDQKRPADYAWVSHRAEQTLRENRRFISPSTAGLATGVFVVVVLLVLALSHVIPLVAPLLFVAGLAGWFLGFNFTSRVQSSTISKAYKDAEAAYHKEFPLGRGPIEMQPIAELKKSAELNHRVIDPDNFDDEEDEEAALLSKGPASGRVV